MLGPMERNRVTRTIELVALVAAGALGAGLVVLTVGASPAFLLPGAFGVGLVAALVTPPRRREPRPPSSEGPQPVNVEVEARLAMDVE